MPQKKKIFSMLKLLFECPIVSQSQVDYMPRVYVAHARRPRPTPLGGGNDNGGPGAVSNAKGPVNNYREWRGGGEEGRGGGGGGYKTVWEGGGKSTLTPIKRKGAEKVLAMLGGTKSLGVVSTQALEVLAIPKWEGTHSFYHLKGGHNRFYPVLRGGGRARIVTDSKYLHVI